MKQVKWAYDDINVGDFLLVYTSLAHHKADTWLKVTHKEPKPEPVITLDFSGRGDIVGTTDHVGWYASQIKRKAIPSELEQIINSISE